MYPPTVQALLLVMPNAGVERLTQWIAPLEQAMTRFDITTPARARMWVANIAHESRELLELEESFRYRAPRLREVFPRCFATLAEAERYVDLGPPAIAARVYASRLGNGDEASGDGWVYRGRGPLGVTFRANYSACSSIICGDADTLLSNPEFLTLPEFGAASAGWYWDARRCNEAADAGDFDAVCDLINLGRRTLAKGDSNGYASRDEYYRAALATRQP